MNSLKNSEKIKIIIYISDQEILSSVVKVLFFCKMYNSKAFAIEDNIKAFKC